ncbi:MAG: polyprenyl synthetase family protein [Candidatus Magnetomorum sp.]|nr:polyprenyl synthetase family protein [Candidatus Magnetomorum sp.]
MKKQLKKKIMSSVADDLEQIEIALKHSLDPYLELVQTIAGHILFSGGKRLRPLLMVICARMCGYGNNDLIHFSTMFEYLHVATLLHDDVIDQAKMRRGKKAAHHVFGAAETVLTGDYLLAKSLAIAGETGKMAIIQLAAKITEEMAQGELLQMINQRNPHLTETDYLTIVQSKTAVLMQAACESGAIIADASPDILKAVSNYGRNIGIAFQIADDILDYTAETHILGKQIGADLREGKLTLPVIYTLQQANPTERVFIEKIIQDVHFSHTDFEKLIDIMRTYNSVNFCLDQAKAFVEKARKPLMVIPETPEHQILYDIADFVVARDN